MLRRVALVRTDVSEEPSASFIRVTRFDELGTTLAVTSNRRTLIVTASVVLSSLTLVTLMKEALSSFKTSVLTRAHGVTSQKTPFFIVTTVKTSNLTWEVCSEMKRTSGRPRRLGYVCSCCILWVWCTEYDKQKQC
jgi:hypothetical protein